MMHSLIGGPRCLYEATWLPARAIAEVFNWSEAQVLSQARYYGWKRPKGYDRNFWHRYHAKHAPTRQQHFKAISRNARTKTVKCQFCKVGHLHGKTRRCLSCGRRKQATKEQKRRQRWLRPYDGHKPGWLTTLERLGLGYGKAIEARRSPVSVRGNTGSRKTRAGFRCTDEMVGEMLKRNPGRLNLSVSWAGIVWASQYWLDDGFRAREIARTQVKEARRWRCADDGTLTGAVVQRMFAEAKDCHWCGKEMHPRDKTMDHLVALSRGGAHSIHNVVVACLRCNVKRGARAA